MSDQPGNGGQSTPPEGATPPEGGKQTFTQDELNRIVGERVARERAKFPDYEDLKSKATQLDELQQSQRSDVDRLTGERDTFKGRAETAESRLLRYDVAAAKGLPMSWAKRLTGSTKEELEADADALLEELGTRTGGFDGGSRGSVERTNDMNQLIRRGAGRG